MNAQYILINGKSTNKGIINGQLHEIKIDTIEQIEDTLWIKADRFIDNKLKESSVMKGRIYNTIRRPWTGPRKIRLLSSTSYRDYYRIIPKARYRDEGILILSKVKTITGPGSDSVIYSEGGFRKDSIKDESGNLLWKFEPKPYKVNIECGIPSYPLRETLLRKERKKKRAKRRKK